MGERLASLGLLFALLFLPYTPVGPASPPPPGAPPARYVILMIADGWGIKQIEATNAYSGSTPAYQSWLRRFVSTYAAGGSYDPAQAWASFSYVKNGYTDSAAAATALYTGGKTSNGNISVSVDRLYAITEKARLLGRAVGAVTTVPISHATPGAWEAHNDSRNNYAAIADEGYWGDPDTTGAHAGDHGPTLPALDVLIGGGHPAWKTGYVTVAQRDKLAAENGQPGAFAFVERSAGSLDGGDRLLAAANTPGVTRLAGLFGGSAGNIEYRLADGSGHNPENPTLAEMTLVALRVLARNPNGFVLLVEGGAVDWAGHANNMNQLIGEMIGFDEAVQAAIDWVADPASPADWGNTLVVITGDHETGYLTAAPDVFPDQPLGAVNGATLALERLVAGSDRRASWDDAANPGVIDPGETVYWAWNSGNHTNSLIPLYARGAGAHLFEQLATNSDPLRGAYLDNTGVHAVMDALVADALAVTAQANGAEVRLSWTHDKPYTGYEVRQAAEPYFSLANSSAITLALPGLGATMIYTDAAGAGDPVTHHFYQVRAFSETLLLAASPPVGEFDYALIAGE